MSPRPSPGPIPPPGPPGLEFAHGRHPSGPPVPHIGVPLPPPGALIPPPPGQRPMMLGGGRVDMSSGSQSGYSSGAHSPAPDMAAVGQNSSLPGPGPVPPIVPVPGVAIAGGPSGPAGPSGAGPGPASGPAAGPGSGPGGFDVASYAYNIGFIHAAWADTYLTVANLPTLRLHALFASRSPVLYQYLNNATMANSGPPYHISIGTEDPYVSSITLSMALATLYGHNLDLSSCDLTAAKGLIASACLLGIDSVASVGYQVLVSLINKDTITDVFSFAFSNIDGHSRRDGGVRLAHDDSVSLSYEGPYPPFTSGLVAQLVSHLLQNLAPHVKSLDPIYRTILLNLPFQLLKHVIESPALEVKSPMERHGFAKEVVALREANRKEGPHKASYEESVVLAFGGGKGGVEVIRRPVGGAKKTLWKASS